MDTLFPNPSVSIPLSNEEIALAIELLCDQGVPTKLKEEFLTQLNQREESAEELAGFSLELLKRAVRPEIDRDENRPLVELCGTGGDKAGLLNISTAAMFVVAGAGGRVVKHGNRAVSSRCGSADVLEALGVTLHFETRSVPEILDRSGCVFFLASDFHPVVALLAPVRRSLAMRGQTTIFNLLGPLLNPAMPECQLTGVYRRSMLPRYIAAMGLMGRNKAWAVCGDPPVDSADADMEGVGIDELTVTGLSHVFSLCGGVLGSFELHPEKLGLPLASSYAGLKGGDASENAERIFAILSNQEQGVAREMIILNAGAALYLAGVGDTLEEGIRKACASIDSGKALASLQALRLASVSNN
ncbi:MAG: anthranilate phosphoribosyltransferase [bacterium]